MGAPRARYWKLDLNCSEDGGRGRVRERRRNKMLSAQGQMNNAKSFTKHDAVPGE